MIIKEEKTRSKSQSLDVDSYYSISKQLPFFACPSFFYTKDSSLVVSKYFYCKEFGIPTHPGTFSEQPNKWIEHSFFIGNCINKVETMQLEKAKGSK